MNKISEAVAGLPGRWFKGNIYDANKENFCGLGHLWNVHGLLGKSVIVAQSPEILGQADLMDEVAIEQYPDRIPFRNEEADRAFAQFNDHPATTEDEVIAVMEKAAVRWDEKV